MDLPSPAGPATRGRRILSARRSVIGLFGKRSWLGLFGKRSWLGLFGKRSWLGLFGKRSWLGLFGNRRVHSSVSLGATVWRAAGVGAQRNRTMYPAFSDCSRTS